MRHPWMALYLGELTVDTTHLSAMEFGSYMRLLVHYWAKRGLPNDDARLARIAGVKDEEWVCIRICLAPFFQQNWRHKRVEEELKKASETSKKAANSANKRWINKGKRENAEGYAKAYANGHADAHASAHHNYNQIYKDSLNGESRQESGNGSCANTEMEQTMDEQELKRHVAGHKVYVKQDTPAGEAWATWARTNLRKSQVWDAKGGWWFPSEYPPTMSGPSSN